MGSSKSDDRLSCSVRNTAKAVKKAFRDGKSIANGLPSLRATTGETEVIMSYRLVLVVPPVVRMYHGCTLDYHRCSSPRGWESLLGPTTICRSFSCIEVMSRKKNSKSMGRRTLTSCERRNKSPCSCISRPGKLSLSRCEEEHVILTGLGDVLWSTAFMIEHSQHMPISALVCSKIAAL